LKYEVPTTSPAVLAPQPLTLFSAQTYFLRLTAVFKRFRPHVQRPAKVERMSTAAGVRVVFMAHPHRPVRVAQHPNGERGQGTDRRSGIVVEQVHQVTMPLDMIKRQQLVAMLQSLGELAHTVIETCAVCGGARRIIACLEDPVVIEKILAHLDAKAAAGQASRPPPCRAPPARPLG